MGNSRAQIPRRIDRIPGGTAKGESDRQYQETDRKSGECTQPESNLLAIQDNTLQQFTLHTNKTGRGQIEDSEDQNKCTDDFSDRIACIISYFRNCGKNGEVDTRILRGSEVISVSQIDENGPDECAKKLRSEVAWYHSPIKKASNSKTQSNGRIDMSSAELPHDKHCRDRKHSPTQGEAATSDVLYFLLMT